MREDDVADTIKSLVSANQALMNTLNIIVLELRHGTGFDSQRASTFLRRVKDAPAANVPDMETYDQILQSYIDLLNVQPKGTDSAEVLDFPRTPK